MKGNTSVSLGPHFEGFIADKVAEGRYKNASEVVRSALRLLEDEEQERQQKVKALREAIQKGLDSGVAVDFDFAKFKEQMKARSRARQQVTD